MAFNYLKLRGKLREKFGTQERFAAALGMSPATLSKKLNNGTDWSGVEIQTACELLGIPIEDAHLYFFA